MKAMKIKHLLLIALILATAVLSQSARADDPAAGRLTEQERRGKQIFLSGTAASGREVKAVLGSADLEVPAAAMPCASCHGADGQGRPEGGIKPSNITWQSLTKSYGVIRADGRSQPAYTEQTLRRAITEGLDSGGAKLHAAMPRYRMASDDLADLVSYLKRLADDRDPGLTESSIRVGTALPADGPAAEMGQAVGRVLGAYFEEINKQGGVFNRRIELHKLGPSGTEPEQVFAIAGALVQGAEKTLVDVIEKHEIPVVGPLSLAAQDGAVSGRHVFYLYSGVKEQARALVKFAAGRAGEGAAPRMAIVHPESEGARALAEAAQGQIKRLGLEPAATIKYLPGRLDGALIAGELIKRHFDAVFFLGQGSDTLAILKEAAGLQSSAAVFIPGPLVAREVFDLPPSFKGKIHLSFPTLPMDHTPEGVSEYRALAEKHDLSPRHLAAQVSAYCAAKVLVEGLRRAGKDLSREKLLAALEGLYEHSTGLTRAVTFGPNRRIGALGAYVVSVDLEKKQFMPAGEWVELD